MTRSSASEIRRALRPGGHLVLSYSNRFPPAWAALFEALESARFEAVGYTVVHSENETDHAKTGRRACTLDVLIDLVPSTGAPVTRYRPKVEPTTDEEAFCHRIGEWALRIGRLQDHWVEELNADLQGCTFLS